MRNILKSSLLLLTGFCLAKTASAQSDVDAIRYSQTNIAATARSLSMGGAFGALGADFSSLSTNPAGIAFYHRSEFSFTPALENTTTSTDYLGRNSSDNKYNFNLGNVGLVYAYPKENKSEGWKGFAFGIGYNRLNSFHTRSLYEGVNTKNSLLDAYVEEANGIDPNQISDIYPYSSGLAYNPGYAIDAYANDSTSYFSMIPDASLSNSGLLQRNSKETSGSSGEVVLSFGGNYNDKIYWGATLGFPFVRYNEDVLYEEIDQNNTIQLDSNIVGAQYAAAYNFKSFSQSQSLATTGNGFNAKFGLIIRPVDWFRFGVAAHTPAFYSMHDEYITSMTTTFENGDVHSGDSPYGIYDYNITTPWKFLGSAAVIYQQSAILSLDYEFVDYTSAKLHASDYAFSNENFVIRNSYNQQHNVRGGIEWKYGIFAFRGGAGYSTGVLKSSVSSSSTDQHSTMYTGGVGVREKNYFVDLGYAYTQSNGFYQPYTLTNQDVEGAFSKTKDHRFLMTIGFRF